MALNNSDLPEVKGFVFKPQRVTPDSTEHTKNTIPAGAKRVLVSAVTNDADDFIVLPKLADVLDGYEIIISCSAGTNFELRTPATSTEEINSENCDGTKEYLCTDTQIVTVTKIDEVLGWEAHGHSAIGAAVAAVIPD